MTKGKLFPVHIKDEKIIRLVKEKIESGWNFSEWVRNQLEKQLFSAEFLIVQAEVHEETAKNLRKHAEILMKRRQNDIKQGVFDTKNFSPEMRMFLNKVPQWVGEGKDVKALAKRFHAEFGVKIRPSFLVDVWKSAKKK